MYVHCEEMSKLNGKEQVLQDGRTMSKYDRDVVADEPILPPETWGTDLI